MRKGLQVNRQGKLDSLLELLKGMPPIKQVMLGRLVKSEIPQIGVRTSSGLKFYHWIEKQKQWEELVSDDYFSDENGFCYPWYPITCHSTGLAKDYLIFRTAEGFSFRSFDPSKRGFMYADFLDDTFFKDSMAGATDGWNSPGCQFKWGHFAGPNQGLYLLTKRPEEELRSFILNPKNKDQCITEVKIVTGTTPQRLEIKSSNNHYYYGDFLKQGRQQLIRRNSNGLAIYKLEETKDHKLSAKFILKTDLCNGQSGFDPKQHHLWVVRLDSGLYANLAVLKNDGLSIYKYDQSKGDFICSYYDRRFGVHFGWKPQYTQSVQWLSLAPGEPERMLFSGPKGLDLRLLEAQLIDKKEHKYVEIKSETKLESEIKDKHELEITTLDQKKVPLLEIHREIKPQMISLRETLDVSSLYSCVDPRTGQIAFNLPLLSIGNLSVPQLDLCYHAGIRRSTVLGVGWDIPLEYIAVEYRNSPIPDDHVYFWVTSRGPFHLLPNRKIEDTTVFSYKVVELPDYLITFNTENQCWKIIKDDEERIYGGNEGKAICKISGWPHCREVGSALEGLQHFPSQWHLRSYQKQHQMLIYEYDQVEEGIEGGYQYTQAIYLNKITSNQHHVISLSYDNQSSGEFWQKPSQDDEGQFNSVPLFKRYLSEIKLSHPIHRQHVILNYSVRDNLRLLTSFSQPDEAEPVIRFHYDSSSSPQIKQINLPSGVNLNLEYQDVISDLNQHAHCISALCRDAPQLQQNKYFIVWSAVSSESKISSRLKISLRNHSGEELTDNDYVLGSKYVRDYTLVVQDEYLAVLISYDTPKDHALYLFRVDTSQERYLTQQKKLLIGLDKPQIMGGAQFIVVANHHSITRYEWITTSLPEWKEQKITPLSESKALVCTAMQQAAFFYDDQNLWVMRRDVSKNWVNENILRVPGLLENIRTIISQLCPNDATKNQLYLFYTRKLLQIRSNLVFLAGLSLENNRLKTRLTTLVLNSNYQSVSILKKDWTIEQDSWIEKLAGSLKDIPLDDEKWQENFNVQLSLKENKYQLEFVYQEFEKVFVKDKEKYKHKVVAKGQTLSHFLYHLEKTHEKKISSSLETWSEKFPQIMEQRLHNLLLEKGSRYLITLGSQSTQCNNRKYIFNGSQWIESQVDEDQVSGCIVSIKLSDQMILYKESQDSPLQLYRQASGQRAGTAIFNFETSNLADLLVYYPNFIVFRKTNKEIGFLPFSSHATLSNAYLIGKGSLGPLHNPQLVTIIDEDKRVIFYPFPQLSTQHKYTGRTIKIFELDTGLEKRRQSYLYEKKPTSPSATGIIYHQVTLHPGDNKEYYGTQQIITSQKQVIRRIFDAKNAEVKESSHEESKNSEINSSSDDSSALWDRNHHLVVARFAGMDLTQQRKLVDYFAFEDYENNDEWKLSAEAKIVKLGWSLTGKNYLQLIKEASVRKNFDFEHKSAMTASIWIRASSDVDYESLSKCFKAEIYNTECQLLQENFAQFYEEYEHGDWFYIEIPIELKETPSLTEKLSLTLTLSGPLGGFIDIDHIKLIPSYIAYDIYTYHPLTHQLLSSCNQMGLWNHWLYDEKSRALAVIEQGIVRSLHCKAPLSLSHHFRALVKISCSELSFYESFSPFSMQKWQVLDPEHWQISPGELSHPENSDTLHIIRLQEQFYECQSLAVYFNLILKDCSSIELNIAGHKIIIIRNQLTTNRLKSNILATPNLTPNSYLFIIKQKRLCIWVNENLIIDQSFGDVVPKKEFSIQTKSYLIISKLVWFIEPHIEISYENKLGEKVQKIILVDANTIQVSQCIYDHLGRNIATTKLTQIPVSNVESLCSYQKDFVTNHNNFEEKSFLRTKRLRGKVEDDGLGYYGQSFIASSLIQKDQKTLPGALIPINTHCFNTVNEEKRMTRLFPQSEGFDHQMIMQSNGTRQITVNDKKNRRCALLSRTTNGQDLLTTYSYNEEKNSVLILTPNFHDHTKIQTLYRAIDSWEKISISFSQNPECRKLQESFGIFLKYDEQKNLIEKKTSDIGRHRMFYNKNKLLKFIVQHDKENKPFRIIYHSYDFCGREIEKGYSTIPSDYSEEKLQQRANEDKTWDGEKSVRRVFYVQQTVPSLRSHSQVVVETINNSSSCFETLSFNPDKTFHAKSVRLRDEQISYELESLIFVRSGNKKIMQIIYPVFYKGKPLVLDYFHDHLGNISAISIGSKCLGKMTYNPQQQCRELRVQPDTEVTYTQTFQYNSVGLLTEVINPFWEQRLEYSQADLGSVTACRIKPKWQKRCQVELLTLDQKKLIPQAQAGVEDSKEKLKDALRIADTEKLLKNLDYLDQYDCILQTFPHIRSLDFPVEWVGSFQSHLATELEKKDFFTPYTYFFNYGVHRELIKAKYFKNGEEKFAISLSPEIFHQKFPQKISKRTSESIWEKLNAKKPASSFKAIDLVDEEELTTHLEQYKNYFICVAPVLLTFFSKKETLPKLTFETFFIKWLHSDYKDTQANHKIIAGKIWDILDHNKFLYPHENLFLLEYRQELAQVLPEVIAVLIEHDKYKPGAAPGDLEAFEIDANGNHRVFFQGNQSCRLYYQQASNQIDQVVFGEKKFTIAHDPLGNITRAQHCGIENIIYDETSNRTRCIQLKDGRKITFDYDSKGERVRKTVMGSDSKPQKILYYLRDDQGRSMVETEEFYESGTRYLREVTAYIYGQRGLLGFIRKDVFYSVVTDHQNSVRLVIRNGQVVAAYDYFPYGLLMREYGIPAHQLRYRFTGQEWDEETGLYNYHTRFYDPRLGRFYQVDPKEQYFSPYKYAGNSPASLVDPDGQFAMLPFVIAGFLIGAAIGTVSAGFSSQWKVGPTLLGGLLGGLGGALLPVGFASSVSALAAIGLSMKAAIGVNLALGAAGAYFSVAAAQREICCWKWKGDNPADILNSVNASISGFAIGSSLVAGANAWYGAFKSFAQAGVTLSVQQATLVGATMLSAGGMGYLSGAAANQKWSNWECSPDSFWATLTGAYGGAMLPLGGHHFFTKMSNRLKLATLLSGGLITYLLPSLAQDNFTHWSNSPESVNLAIAGFLLGTSLPGLIMSHQENKKISSQNRGRNNTRYQSNLESFDRLPPHEISEDRIAGSGQPFIQDLRRTSSVFHFSLFAEVPQTEGVPRLYRRHSNPPRRYLRKHNEGTYGGWRGERERIRRISRYNNYQITGSTHEAEHTIGCDVLISADPELGVNRRQGVGREIQNLAPSYYEEYPLHRVHRGTGTHNTRDGSGMTSGEYRGSQRVALIQDHSPGNAIQLNQLGYAHLPDFSTQVPTLDRQVASDSFLHMLSHVPEQVHYLNPDGSFSYAFFTPVQRAEAHLSRLTAERGRYPLRDEQIQVAALYQVELEPREPSA